MNFYSQELDYNFINSTFKNESSSIQREESDEKINQRLIEEAKSLYKNKMPKYASR